MPVSKASQTPALLILSGLSGSGKTTALQALEDQGYFCIDNLPVTLIPALLQQQQQQPQEYPWLAIGLDARSMAVLGVMGLVQMPLALVLMTEATRYLPAAEVSLFYIGEAIG